MQCVKKVAYTLPPPAPLAVPGSTQTSQSSELFLWYHDVSTMPCPCNDQESYDLETLYVCSLASYLPSLRELGNYDLLRGFVCFFCGSLEPSLGFFRH